MILIGYISIYGTTRVSWIADQLERDHPEKEARFKNFYEIFAMLQGKYIPVLNWMTVISNASLTAAAVIVNETMLGIFWLQSCPHERLFRH